MCCKHYRPGVTLCHDEQVKKIIASTFVAAAMVIAIPAPSNAAPADTSTKSSVTTSSKTAPVTSFAPFRIDWY